MKSQYSLPCECGQSVTIDTGQAGQQVQCACGKVLDVPTMRDIRALEPVIPPPSAASQATRLPWTRGQTGSFLGGLLLTLVALTFLVVLGVAYGAFQNEMTMERDLEAGAQFIDTMTMEQCWDMWVFLRDRGLGEPQPPQYVIDQRRAARIVSFMVVAGVLALGGAALVAGTFAVRSRQRARAARGVQR